MSTVRDIKPLTGIRFIAAAWVLLYHQRIQFTAVHGSRDGLELAFSDGWMAVPFFFLLSGFILAHVYFDKYRIGDHWKFIWLRFARLWPVHVACLVPMVVARLAVGTDRSFAEVVPELAMVRLWYDSKFEWNVPAWSIQCEWFAYLFIFPACFYILRRVKSAAVLLPVIVGLIAVSDTLYLVPPGRILAIVPLFIAGFALQRLHVALPALNGHLLALGGVAGFLAGNLMGSVTACYLSFAAIILGLAYDGWLARILSGRAIVYGGTISFALYMSHKPLFKITDAIIAKMQWEGYTAILVPILLALPLAIAVHHLVEVPCNRWLRSNPRHPHPHRPESCSVPSLPAPGPRASRRSSLYGCRGSSRARQ